MLKAEPFAQQAQVAKLGPCAESLAEVLGLNCGTCTGCRFLPSPGIALQVETANNWRVSTFTFSHVVSTW